MNSLDVLYFSLSLASLLLVGAVWYFVINVNEKLTLLIDSLENSMEVIDDTAKMVKTIKNGVSYGAFSIITKLLKV